MNKASQVHKHSWILQDLWQEHQVQKHSWALVSQAFCKLQEECLQSETIITYLQASAELFLNCVIHKGAPTDKKNHNCFLVHSVHDSLGENVPVVTVFMVPLSLRTDGLRIFHWEWHAWLGPVCCVESQLGHIRHHKQCCGCWFESCSLWNETFAHTNTRNSVGLVCWVTCIFVSLSAHLSCNLRTALCTIIISWFTKGRLVTLVQWDHSQLQRFFAWTPAKLVKHVFANSTQCGCMPRSLDGNLLVRFHAQNPVLTITHTHTHTHTHTPLSHQISANQNALAVSGK